LSFFFSSRRLHTSFSRDWSSDVCSSDLIVVVAIVLTIVLTALVALPVVPVVLSVVSVVLSVVAIVLPVVPAAVVTLPVTALSAESGRASGRGKEFLAVVGGWLNFSAMCT